MNEILIPNFFIKFSDKSGKEKIIIGPLDNGNHLTIHLGTNSKVFDIHIKNEVTGEYHTLLQLKYETLEKIFECSLPKIKTLVIKCFSNKICMGKLKKNNCLLVPFDSSLPESQILKINSSKDKVTFNKNIKLDSLRNLYFFPHELNLLEESYFLYRFTKGSLRKNGIIFKIENQKRFVHLTNNNMNKLIKGIFEIISSDLKIISPLEGEKFKLLFNDVLFIK